MAVTDNDLRDYLRLLPDSAEKISGYLAAAKSKARAAGIPDYKSNAQYDLFIMNLAAMYYDHRGLAFSGSYQATAEDNATKMVNGFVLELRYANEDEVVEA